MFSTSNLNTKGGLLLSTVLAAGLVLAGCGGSDSDPEHSMSDVMDPPGTGSNNGGGPGGGDGSDDMSDLGEWALVRADGVPVGYEHTGYNLMARFDSTGANPTITASSPTHQPQVSGTWSGRWSLRYTALTSESGALDETDDGDARVNVTIAGSNVDAVLTYSGIDVPGLPSSISSDRASVSNGRFAPSVTVSIPTETGGRVSRTFSGLGQFGGTDQKGVVGYVSGQDFRSVFYGGRQ